MNTPASTASAITDEQIRGLFDHLRYGERVGPQNWDEFLETARCLFALADAAPTTQPTGQAVEPSKPASVLPTADDLGRSVAVWTGGVYEHFRGDTGKPEPWLKVSVERLGYGIEAILKDIRTPAPAAPDFETWLRSVCITAPSAAAYDLAKDAWAAAIAASTKASGGAA